MSAQIEARRLSGVDLGKTVTVGKHLGGPLVVVEHSADGVALLFAIDDRRGMQANLAPTDLVTIHDRTTTPTPKETP